MNANPTITLGTNPSVLCNGTTSANLSYTLGGGTPNQYQYSISYDGAATGLGFVNVTNAGLPSSPISLAIPTNVPGGAYNGTLTATLISTGCVTAAMPFTINIPDALTASISSQTDVDCNGNSTGSVTIDPAGGTEPYTFSKDGSDFSNTTGTFGSLAAGSYTITVKDGNGCTATQAVIIGEPSILTASITSQTNEDCYGNSIGSVTVAGAGGTFPYHYSIDGMDFTNTNGTFGALAAGSYIIIVKDAHGCIASQTVTITQPTQITATITIVNACFDGNGGTVKIEPAGGLGSTSADYFLLPIVGGGPDIDPTATQGTPIAPGHYSYLIFDNSGAAGCNSQIDFDILKPSVALGGSATSTNITCNGNGDGNITVTGTGGYGTYQYSINGTDWLPAGGTTSSYAFTGLVSNSYTVQVRDFANTSCTYTLAIQSVVTEPDVLAASGTGTNVDCNGNSTGSASVNVSGGTMPYSYSWSNGGTSKDISLLPAGLYSVIVTDANGCTATGSYNVTEPTLLTTSISGQADATCNGTNTGSATILASGGTPAYTFTIHGTATSNTDGNFAGLAAGSYTFDVQDAHGCTTSQLVTIGEPAALSASIFNQSDVTCNGTSTGSASIAVTGGTSPYTFTIHGTATSNTDGNFTGLAAGSYTFDVQDAHGCTTSQLVTIGEPAALIASIFSQSDATCNGTSTGSATIAATGGTSPYTFTIHGTATSNTDGNFTGLPAGSYTFDVQDAHGCTTSQLVTIGEPAALIASIFNQSDATCNGTSTGSATIAATGGTSPYTFTIHGTATSNTDGIFTGLPAGSYTFDVQDAHGCTTSQLVTIGEPAALIASIFNQSDATCNGTSTGSATIAATGGTSPYTFTIHGTATSNTDGNFTGLAAGSYTFDVQDAHGCTTSQLVTIGEPAALIASIFSQSDATCNGTSTGSATIAATGGTSPYTFTIHGTATSNTDGNFTGLPAGSYTFDVQDAHGCTTSQLVTIGEPAALITSIFNQSDATCNGTSTGSATIAATGGTSPYTFTIHGTATSNTDGIFTGLPAGSYTFDVQDAHGCTTSQLVTIGQPAAIVIANDGSKSDVTCNGAHNGSITLGTVSGGAGSFTYHWTTLDGAIPSGQENNKDLTGLSGGTYKVTITDANGCTTIASSSITEPALLTASGSGTNVDCNGSNTGTASVNVSGGTTQLYLLVEQWCNHSIHLRSDSWNIQCNCN